MLILRTAMPVIELLQPRASWSSLHQCNEGQFGLYSASEGRSADTPTNGRNTQAHAGQDATPVLSVASRKDYVDALLRRKDLVWMVVSGKLKASHEMKLARRGLTFIEHLKDDELFDDLVSHQSSAEEKILEAIREMS
jgi:hypothetical protein